jgi:hypothetical protein
VNPVCVFRIISFSPTNETDPPKFEESPPVIIIPLPLVLDWPLIIEMRAPSIDFNITVPARPVATEPEFTKIEPDAEPDVDLRAMLPDLPLSLPPETTETLPDNVPPVGPEDSLMVPPEIMESPARKLISPELARLDPTCSLTFPVSPDFEIPVLVEIAPEPPKDSCD